MSLKDLIKKYENTGGKTNWLSLKDDGDSVMVRFLHSDENDLDVYEVHEAEVDGFNQSIKCNGEDCYMCREGLKAKLAVYLQMMDLEEDNEIKVWRRGVTDLKRIIEEIEENGKLNERNYKIKRIGKKGDTKTTYQFYAKDKCEMELKEKVKLEGFIIKVISNEDMKKVVDGNYTFKKDGIKDKDKDEDSTSAF